MKSLFISADIDKARHERHVPLTAAALAILARVAPESGLIFGAHDLRDHLKAAALKVLPPEKAAKFAAYDLRHGKARHMLQASGGELLGVSHQLGHRRVTTTNRYLKSEESHGQRVVDALDSVSNQSAEDPVKKKTAVRRRGLEPLRCYPLAPQGSSRCVSPKELEGADASTDAKNTANLTGADSDRSAAGQQALLEAERGLVLQEMIWGDLDAFSAAFADEDES